VFEAVEFHHRGTEAQSHRNEKPQIAQINADSIAPSQIETQRRKDAKPSQSHRIWASKRTGRAATVRPASPKGYTVSGSRGTEPRWTALHAHVRVDRIHLRLASRLRRARPTSVTSKALPTAPLHFFSERSRRELTEALERQAGSPPLQENPGFCSARVPAGDGTIRVEFCQKESPPPQKIKRPCSGRHPCLPSAMRFQPERRDKSSGHPAGETPALQRRFTSPSRSFKKRESGSPAQRRRSRCAPSTVAVGAAGLDEHLCSERPDDSTVAAVEDRRRLRRLPHLRCFAPLRLCAFAFLSQS